MIMILCLLVHANCVSPYLVIPTSILSVCLFVRISWTGSVLASINNDNLYHIHSSGRMEKQETETDTESGNGHGKWKRPLPDQYFAGFND